MQCWMNPAEDAVCNKPCEKMLSCKLHKCVNLCGQPCAQFCHAVVQKDLMCGHSTQLECGQDIYKVKCAYPCITVLPCGHKCLGNCSSCRGGHVKCVECNK